MKVPLTPLDLLTRARRYFPDRVGVIDGHERWTYAEFADRCDRQARFLTDELGVQRGAVVAWLCGNTHELLEAYFGGITDAVQADAIVAEGKADLVAVGRQMLANPNWGLDAAEALLTSGRWERWPVPFGWWLERRDRASSR